MRVGGPRLEIGASSSKFLRHGAARIKRSRLNPHSECTDVRRRILFLSQCLPYPPHSGVTNRTFHILEELQRDFDVTLVAFSRRNHQPTPADRALASDALRQIVPLVLEPVAVDSEWSLFDKLRVHASSVLTGKPYIFFEYGNSRFGQEIKTAIQDAPPDLVHLDSMDLYRWLELIPSVPTTCTHHSVESDLLRLRAERLGTRAASAYVMHQARLVEAVERELCGRFDMNVMTSDTDGDRLRLLASGARTSTVPNGVDVDFFRPEPREQVVRDRVVFLGPTYMFPNRDAVQFFLDAIWPAVREERPAATFRIIGKNSGDEKARFEANSGVTCLGYVPDIRPHFAEAECSVVPLRVGGGTRLKILDAWAMGKAIISTSIGCEGLATANDHNILIRDDPADFAKAIVEVLRDPELRNRLGNNGRKTAEEIYAWPVIGRNLNAIYRQIMETNAAGRVQRQVRAMI
jgi:glycosyltransferase involved in cell wall biosynthesis